MKTALLALALLAIGTPAAARDILICETPPVPTSSSDANVLTQETSFVCPGMPQARSLPDLYRAGWRLIHIAGNIRGTAMTTKASLVVVLEKD